MINKAMKKVWAGILAVSMVLGLVLLPVVFLQMCIF